MYVYVMLLQIRDQRDIAQTVELLANMHGRVPGLTSVEVGQDKARLANSADIGVICKFKSYNDYSAFMCHKRWERVRTHIDRVAESTTVANFTPA